MDESKKRHIEWSKKQEKKPSMKRRCDEHDYTQRGIYMITMATEGRLPLFGTLKGNPLSTSGDDKPQVILSVLGERLKDCWKDIPTHYPEVSVIKRQSEIVLDLLDHMIEALQIEADESEKKLKAGKEVCHE